MIVIPNLGVAASLVLTSVGDPWFMDSIVNIFSDNLTTIVTNKLLPDTGSELIVRVVGEWSGDGCNNGTTTI